MLSDGRAEMRRDEKYGIDGGANVSGKSIRWKRGSKILKLSRLNTQSIATVPTEGRNWNNETIECFPTEGRKSAIIACFPTEGRKSAVFQIYIFAFLTEG